MRSLIITLFVLCTTPLTAGLPELKDKDIVNVVAAIDIGIAYRLDDTTLIFKTADDGELKKIKSLVLDDFDSYSLHRDMETSGGDLYTLRLVKGDMEEVIHFTAMQEEK